jgi:hypothetical protein
MADMTPAAWLELLDRRLTDRWARMKVFDDYFEGHHPLAFATAKFREAFGGLLKEMADNWCRIVVSSSVERLTVQGFRFGGEKAADDDAWGIWQANGLDADSNLAHTEAVKLGEAYWLVDPQLQAGTPVITPEHPSEMIVVTSPGNRRVRLAALKRWMDDDRYVYWNLWLPNEVHKFRSVEKIQRGAAIPGRMPNYMRRPRDGGFAHTLGVPVIPLRNAPTMLTGGTSDLEPGIPLQNAINKLACDMLVAAEFAAYRQRVMTGIEQPEDPVTKKKIEIEAGVSRLMTIEATDGKVFDLPASDLKNYTNAIDLLVQHYAAQTKTPPHYLLSSIVNASGEALTAAEAGLTSKVEDKKGSFGEGHEEALRLAFKALGDDSRASDMHAETIWATSERRSYAEMVDGASKLAAIPGMPFDAVLEELGWSPQRIDRVRAMQAAGDILTFANTPPEATPAGGGQQKAA